jgi:serine/threonine-protein kinase
MMPMFEFTGGGSMSSPVSCARCARPAPSVTPNGLCPTCAVDADTAVTFRARIPAQPPADPPTTSFAVPPEPSTRPGPASTDERPLPAAPPGYQLLRRLGGGGMGEVYLAREATSERLVAMKFLKCPGDPAQYERFVIELRVLAKLNHPDIVRVYASDFLRADPYFTMEYVPGGSLARAAGPLPVAAAVELVRGAAVAIAAAHAGGIVHRDLKPSNILIGDDGAAKVVDFGLAKRLDEADPLTVMSGGLGTPGYMPPEQISRRNGAVGAWSDVYGLGATLYHLLVGKAPFAGDTVADTIAKVLADPPTPLRVARPDVPEALEGVVLKCLEKDPKDRYPTAAAMVADLDNWAAGRRTAAPPLTRLRRARRWATRNRRAIAAAVALAAIAVGLVGAGRALAPVPPVGPRSLPTAPTPDDPAARKQQTKDSIRDRLLAGEAVTLIGATGEPVWYEEPAGPVRFADNPARKPGEPGGCFFASPGLTLLKLLDPPIDRYRVSLELWHVNGSRSKEPALGFYTGGATFTTADGWTEHALMSVGFSDIDPAAGPPAAAAVRIASRVHASPAGRLPSNFLHYSYLASHTFGASKVFPGQWRRVVADVSPERLTVYWDPPAEPPGGAVPFADLPVADIREHQRVHAIALRVAGQEFNHPFTPLPPWSPRLAIGVWASAADVAVRNVVVTPR